MSVRVAGSTVMLCTTAAGTTIHMAAQLRISPTVHAQEIAKYYTVIPIEQNENEMNEKRVSGIDSSATFEHHLVEENTNKSSKSKKKMMDKR